MKKLIGVFTILLVGIVLLAGCDLGSSGSNDLGLLGIQEEQVEETGMLNITLTFSGSGLNTKAKALSIAESSVVPASYKYTAECISNPGASGTETTAGGKELIVNAQGKASIKLMPGEWKVTIYIYNADGGLIMKGEKQQNLTAQENSLMIICKSADGDGKANLNIVVGAPKIENGKVNIYWSKVGTSLPIVPNKVISTGEDGKDWNSEKTGYVRFSANYNDMTAQTYFMKMSYVDKNDTVVSGQSFVFKAVEKGTTNVTGNFNYGAAVEGGLEIVSDPVSLNIAIGAPNGKSFTATCSTKYKDGDAEKDVTVTEWIWYVNGEVQSGATAAYTFDKTEIGQYNIVCIAKGTVHDVDIYGFASVDYAYDGASLTVI